MAHCAATSVPELILKNLISMCKEAKIYSSLMK